jgi:hypothetical protein
MKVLKYGTFCRLEELKRRQKAKDYLMYLVSVALLLIYSCFQVYYYLIFEYEIQNLYKENLKNMPKKFRKNFKINLSVTGIQELEYVSLRLTAYEIFLLLLHFSKLVTLFLSKLIKLDEAQIQVIGSVYCLILQAAFLFWILPFWKNSSLGLHLSIGYVILLLMQLNTVNNNIAGLQGLNTLFHIDNVEISEFGLDSVWVICQHNIKTGKLLKCNHVFHLKCIIPQYFQTSRCPYCDKGIEISSSLSSLQKDIASHRLVR